MFQPKETGLYKRAGAIRISVTDTGAGLSEAQLQDIGKEGVQFNANKLQAGGGSGLGLYISKGLAHQHGGTFSAKSDGLGKGATFIVELPLFDLYGATDVHILRTEPASAVSPETILLKEDVESNKYSLRVLVVDDATSNCKIMKRILEAHGHSCDTAENGEVALNLVKDMLNRGEQYDTILSDWEMPVMDGPTSVQEMRNVGCSSFIVGITGNVFASDVEYFKSHGANAVLGKPLNYDALQSLFKQHRASAMLDKTEPLKTSTAVVPTTDCCANVVVAANTESYKM